MTELFPTPSGPRMAISTPFGFLQRRSIRPASPTRYCKSFTGCRETAVTQDNFWTLGRIPARYRQDRPRLEPGSTWPENFPARLSRHGNGLADQPALAGDRPVRASLCPSPPFSGASMQIRWKAKPPKILHISHALPSPPFRRAAIKPRRRCSKMRSTAAVCNVFPEAQQKTK